MANPEHQLTSSMQNLSIASQSTSTTGSTSASSSATGEGSSSASSSSGTTPTEGKCPSCRNVLNVQNLQLDYTTCTRRPPQIGTFSGGYPGLQSGSQPQLVIQQPQRQQTFTQAPPQSQQQTFIINRGGGQALILTENDIRALSASGVVLIDPRTRQPFQFVDPVARRRLMELVSALPTWKYTKHESKAKDGAVSKKDTTSSTEAGAEDSSQSSSAAEKAAKDKAAAASDKPKPLGVDEADVLTDCRICLMDFEDGEELVTLPCLHFFHKDEIYKWLLEDKPVCPMCMTPVMISSSSR